MRLWPGAPANPCVKPTTCAWNASTTEPEDFNRRIGGVLFGEPGDHFGQAIELLAQTHSLPGMQGMQNRRFWEHDFQPNRSPAAIEKSSARLLELVRPAIEHLQACRKTATVNADLLDAFLQGARRMELIGTRMRIASTRWRLHRQKPGPRRITLTPGLTWAPT